MHRPVVDLDGCEANTSIYVDDVAQQAVADDVVPTAFVILSHPPRPKPQVMPQVRFADQVQGDFEATAGLGMLSLYARGLAVASDAASAVQSAIADPGAFALDELKKRGVERLYLALV